MAPDLEYLREPSGPGFAHSAWGQLVFCLPVSVLVTWVAARYVGPALGSRLPPPTGWRLEDLRLLLNPFSSRRNFLLAATSSLIASFSHLLLDALPHSEAWRDRAFPGFGNDASFLGSRLSLALGLQLSLSVVGMLVALVLIGRLLRRSLRAAEETSRTEAREAGAGLLVDASTAGIVMAVLLSRDVIRHPVAYFQAAPLYVWGYVAFRAWCAGFVGLALAAMVLERAR
jgi:hypothetical protein